MGYLNGAEKNGLQVTYLFNVNKAIFRTRQLSRNLSQGQKNQVKLSQKNKTGYLQFTEVARNTLKYL